MTRNMEPADIIDDDTLSKTSSTSFTSVGVSEELVNTSLKETGSDGKRHEVTFRGITKENAPLTESVEKHHETENTATRQETLSVFSEGSQSLPHELSTGNTQGNLLPTSFGVNKEQSSVQFRSMETSRDGNGCTATSCITTPHAVSSSQLVKKRIKTNAETRPGGTRLTDMETLSPLIRADPLQSASDNRQSQADVPSPDNSKESSSTGTSTDEISDEQDMYVETSQKSGLKRMIMYMV